MAKIYTGVFEDNRTKKEKSKDWNAKELLASAPVVKWEEKKKWRTFTPRNQTATSTCVAQTVAKLLEINEKNESKDTIVFSASKSYAMRSNKSEGSSLYEMLKNAVEPPFYSLETRIKSQYLNSDKEVEKEAQKWIGHDSKIAQKYAGKSYLMIDVDTEMIAYWISQGFGVGALFFFTTKEWSKKYPVILNKELKREEANRHGVALVDFGLIKGKKYFKVEDSAWFGGINERWVSEEWIKNRCYGAGMVFDRPNDEIPEAKYIFKSIMRFGQRSDDIKLLQDRLKKEELFPLSIPSTGYYGEITRQAVESYQRLHKVASEWELNIVQGKIVGLKTLFSLNANRT